MNNGAILYRTDTNKQVARFLADDITSYKRGHDIFKGIDVSPLGRFAALGMISGEVAVFWGENLEHKACSFQAFPLWKTTGVSTLKFDPTGSLIAVGSGGRTVSPGEEAVIPSLRFVGIWHSQSGKIESVLAGQLGPVSQLAWSPDGRYLIVAAGDATIRVWERHAVPRPKLFTAELGIYAYTITLTNAGRIVAASAGTEVRFFDIAGSES